MENPFRFLAYVFYVLRFLAAWGDRALPFHVVPLNNINLRGQ